MSAGVLEPFLDPETKKKRLREEDLDISARKEIGRGKRGVVFKAKLRSTNEWVAVKRLNQTILRGDKSEELLAREVMIQANAQHPAICPLVGFIDDRCQPTIVTKLAPNGSLDDIFCDLVESGKLKGRWSLERIMCCLYGVASALHYLHSKDIIHRDVKPANILLGNPPPKPLLSDFGCSRETIGEQLTYSNRGVGSYFFLAPEIDDGHYGCKVDVYAWAMTAYLLLNGEKWVTLDTGDTVGIVERQPPPASYRVVNEASFRSLIREGHRPERSEKIPDPVWDIISRGWAPNPEDRPTFAEILHLINEDPDAYSMGANAAQKSEFRKYIDGLGIE